MHQYTLLHYTKPDANLPPGTRPKEDSTVHLFHVLPSKEQTRSFVRGARKQRVAQKAAPTANAAAAAAAAANDITAAKRAAPAMNQSSAESEPAKRGAWPPRQQQ